MHGVPGQITAGALTRRMAGGLSQPSSGHERLASGGGLLDVLNVLCRYEPEQKWFGQIRPYPPLHLLQLVQRYTRPLSERPGSHPPRHLVPPTGLEPQRGQGEVSIFERKTPHTWHALPLSTYLISEVFPPSYP